MSVSEDKIALVKALFQRGLDAQEKIFDEAMRKHEEEFFMSSQPCGCDKEAHHLCERHKVVQFIPVDPQKGRTSFPQEDFSFRSEVSKDLTEPWPLKGSTQDCGCDNGLEVPWVCERHRTEEVNRRDAEWIRLHPQYAQDKAYREGRQWPGDFTIKDSGQRQQFSSGMQRDVTTDKTDYSLVFDGPMLERWAVHLTKGAVKYSSRNWMKANGQEELDRFKQSAVRHFVQWLRGDQDEDHAAAVYFNICGVEYVRAKLEGK